MHIYINLTRPPSHLLTWAGILATFILYAPASFANADEDVHACQGLLYDMRADNRTTVFIEDLTLVTPSNGQYLSLINKSNLSGVQGFDAHKQVLHDESDAAQWNVWYADDSDAYAQPIRYDLRVSKFTGRFSFRSQTNNVVLVSIDGNCNLR